MVRKGERLNVNLSSISIYFIFFCSLHSLCVYLFMRVC